MSGNHTAETGNAPSIARAFVSRTLATFFMSEIDDGSPQNTGDGSPSSLIPQTHGGALAPPFPPGHSGNPGGRPQYKRLTEAYNRILDLSAEELEKFQPRTVAEIVALGQVKAAAGRAYTLQDGAVILAEPKTTAAKEIADRVEGKAKETIEHQGLGALGDVISEASERARNRRDPKP